jgi:hypothetical protein
MREYLKDLNIVGGVGVWSEGEICRYSIESLLKHCNMVFITCDYSDEKTSNIVEEYKEKYPNQIIVGDTIDYAPSPDGLSFPDKMRRQKTYCGQLIQANFDMVKVYNEIHPVDILIFIDSDEMFTDNLPNVINKFLNSDADTVFIKPIEVYDSMNIICNKGLVSHAKIYKYTPEITSIPYSKQNYYLPYRRERKILKESWNFIHLDRLTQENRALRSELRLGTSDPEMKLRRVSIHPSKLTPAQAEAVDRSELFIRLKDWDGNEESVPLIL